MADRREQILAIIAGKADMDVEELKDENTWGEIGLDSLDVVELVMDFENAFSLRVPDNEMEQLATVGDAIKYIESK